MMIGLFDSAPSKPKMSINERETNKHSSLGCEETSIMVVLGLECVGLRQGTGWSVHAWQRRPCRHGEVGLQDLNELSLAVIFVLRM